MPFNVLLLPLLGGYVFISNWNRTRFDARRYSGERLLFHAAIAGVVFLLLAFVATRAVMLVRPEVYGWWRELVPFEYTGTSFLAFVLGSVGWWPLNFLFHRDRQSRRVIERRGDFLEMLFSRSIDRTEQLSISLSSGKVYVGFVTSNLDPAFDRKYMRLLPMLSGYRDRETNELVITRDYAEVYEEYLDEEKSYLAAFGEEFQLVIPVAEITTANLFDPDVYQLFNPS